MKRNPGFVFVVLIAGILLAACSNGTSDGDSDSLPDLLEEIGRYSLTGYSYYFDVSGDVAVISNNYDDAAGYKLQIVDISDRENPQLFSSMDTGGFVPGIVVDGDSAYVARQEYDEGDGWVTLLQEIDLTTTGLTASQERTLLIHPTSDLALYEGYLYLVTGDGVVVIDADEIATDTPTTVGTEISNRIYIDADAKRAYVTGQNNLLDVFDITDPAGPVLLDPGSLENPYSSEGSPTSIAVRDDYVSLPWSGNGIVLLDISNLGNIQLVDIFETGDTAIDIEFMDDYSFVADGDEGIQTMDITDPRNPVQLGQTPTSGGSWRLKRIGDELFVLDRDNGLIVYDLTGL